MKTYCLSPLFKSIVSWLMLFSIITTSSCNLTDTKNQMQEGATYQERTMDNLDAPQIRNSKPPKSQTATSCGWVGKGLLILGGVGLVASIVMNGVQSSWLKNEKNDNSQLTSQNNQLTNQNNQMATQLSVYNACSQLYPNGYSIVGSNCMSYPTQCSSLYGSNCIQCGNAGCLTCNSGTYLISSKQSCQSCASIIPSCSSCYVSNSNTLCNSCTGSTYPSSNGLACQSCSTIIPSCNSCTLSNGKATCTICSNGNYVLSNGLACQLCSTSIPNCSSCYTSNSNIVCSSCSSSTYPSLTGLSCQPCSSVIPNCSSCSTNNGNTLCNACSNTYTLTNNDCVSTPSTAINCTSSYGTGCTTCTSSQCLDCTTGTYLYSISSNPSCSSCSTNIPNCLTCSTNNGNLACSSCSGSNFPSLTGLSCQSCSNVIPNCNTCITSNGSTICSSCNNNYFISYNNLSCQSCSTIIPNCVTCTSSGSSTSCTQCNTGYTQTNNGCILTTTNSTGNYSFGAVTTSNCSNSFGFACTACNSSSCTSCSVIGNLTFYILNGICTYNASNKIGFPPPYISGYLAESEAGSVAYCLLAEQAAQIGYNIAIYAFTSINGNNIDWLGNQLWPYTGGNPFSSCPAALSAMQKDIGLARSNGLYYALASIGGGGYPAPTFPTDQAGLMQLATNMQQFANTYNLDGFDFDIEVNLANSQQVAAFTYLLGLLRYNNQSIILTAAPILNAMYPTTGLMMVTTGFSQDYNPAILQGFFSFIWPQAYSTAWFTVGGCSETNPCFIPNALNALNGSMANLYQPAITVPPTTVLVMGEPAGPAGASVSVFSSGSSSQLYTQIAGNFTGSKGAMAWTANVDVANGCQFIQALLRAFNKIPVTNVCPAASTTCNVCTSTNVP